MTETHVFEHRTLLRHPRDVVFRWLANPGALQRMNPPFASELVHGPTNGLAVGSETRLRISPPGSLGLLADTSRGLLAGMLPDAVSSRIPAAATPKVPWHARHTAYEEGRMFRDEMVSGPLRSWTHTHTLEDAAAGEADTAAGTPGTVVLDRIEYVLPGEGLLGRVPGIGGTAAAWAGRGFEAELRRQFAYRARVMADDLAFHAAHPGPLTGGPARTVAVTGASGLIGAQLTALLMSGGHRVIRLVRSPEQAAAPDAALWDPARERVDESALSQVDVIVNLAGEPIAGRFTDAHKEAVHDSRVRGTRTLVDAMGRLPRVPALVNCSAIGYYGAHAGTGPFGAGLGEELEPGDDFLAEVCAAWEAEAVRAEAFGARVARVRVGVVLSPAGGMLQQVLPLFLAGLGGPMATSGGESHDGSPWVSWVGVDDVAGAFAHAVLDDDVAGPLNAVAPEPVTAKEFATVLGRVLHRPSVLPVPAFGPRLLLGAEGDAETVRADQKVEAGRLVDSGYAMRDDELEGALRHVLGR
ncbi:TIGR01777 family oxidoreductase [Micrococcus sp. NPDC078436]|uniref:TIGR01777 family oxidoreductase n=1 Tax=unclassified Micrococcus TaxID=2620948 RepID=UPI0029AED9FE|nr:TIGR01777 family oxidoreductase [Micrococcus sp. M4NT]MDX2341174.1 TIGR01777 family oxidoreductase [Micrococcus sp. M4NT]